MFIDAIMSRYLEKEAGGNGAIEVYSDSQITGIVSNSSTTSSGTVSAYSADNVAFGRTENKLIMKSGGVGSIA